MPVVDGKIVPDYKLVDDLRVASAFCPDAVRNTIKLKPKPGDTFLATFPKCGTTWTQQILLLLWNDAKPCANGREFMFKCPYLEITGPEVFDHLPEPRLAKIHLPFNLAPYSPDAKYIFVARNPKDCLVSFYHHTRSNLYDFVGGDFNVYFEMFLNGQVDYGDFFDHVLSWYEHRNDPNVLFLYYENMKKDIETAIKQMATFLGPQYEALVENHDKMKDVVNYSSLEYMKKHTNEDPAEMFGDALTPGVDLDKMPLPSGVKFMANYLRSKNIQGFGDFKLVRKGIIGDWRANFTEDQNKRMNEKIEKKLKGTEMLDFWNSIGCL